MLISEYISKDFPAFDLDTPVSDALEHAEDFNFTHVFIKKKGVFCGAISRETLEDIPANTLSELQIHSERFAILNESNIIDSVKLFYTFNTNIVPVINKTEKYLGYVSYDDVFGELSKYPIFSENGALLTVETPIKSYSFTEIAKIVETNNTKFYGCFISQINGDFVQITMRISNENLSSIDETFERYGYSVLRKFYNDEKEDMMKDRYKFFQKYLEF